MPSETPKYIAIAHRRMHASPCMQGSWYDTHAQYMSGIGVYIDHAYFMHMPQIIRLRTPWVAIKRNFGRVPSFRLHRGLCDGAVAIKRRNVRDVYQIEQQAPLPDLCQHPKRGPTGLGFTDRGSRLLHLLRHHTRSSPLALLGRIHGETG